MRPLQSSSLSDVRQVLAGLVLLAITGSPATAQANFQLTSVGGEDVVNLKANPSGTTFAWSDGVDYGIYNYLEGDRGQP